MTVVVDTSGRYLRRDGEPWFPIGDTAWELLHRLRLDEAEHYLRTRARQGFNTILTVGIAEFGGLSVPNAGGDLPFEDGDPSRPDEAYWRHADRVIDLANQLGLVVGLLPTWGSHWCDGEVPFFDAASAGSFGDWIARRYRDRDIYWVLGGDRRISTVDHRDVIEAFAAALRGVVDRDQLITFHPRGQASSSDDLADAEWLDFDMIQSSHTGWNTPNYQHVEQDYQALPVRPVLDAEPNYENHPVMTPSWERVPGWRFDDRDVRRSAYHAVFAGACGHVYGCHDIWQFLDPERSEAINGANLTWREALELPGANQMKHLGALVAELDLLRWQPDQSVIARGAGFLGGHQRAMTRDGRVLIYAPPGRTVALRPEGAGRVARRWSPSTGIWDSGSVPLHGDRPVVPAADTDAVILVEPA